ncbi:MULTISPECIES: hypothetical protein [Pseudomonas]|uniref:hypothetical protein n=1 Tax=Pseudomonas brassicacearum TaxID=930166 RepID=UPI0011CE0BFA
MSDAGHLPFDQSSGFARRATLDEIVDMERRSTITLEELAYCGEQASLLIRTDDGKISRLSRFKLADISNKQIVVIGKFQIIGGHQQTKYTESSLAKGQDYIVSQGNPWESVLLNHQARLPYFPSLIRSKGAYAY